MSVNKTIIVGTDCSGIEAPIHALKQMEIDYHHAFSSDIDKYCRENIQSNYHPDTIYHDITTRDHSNLPKLDLYIAGFPCQTFSTLGKRQGFEDTRGTIFFDCYKTILATSPTVFVLENVKGLLTHNNGQTFETIIDTLKSSGIYDVQWKLLNTKDYGIPQNRQRVFIIGVKHSQKLGEIGDPVKQPLNINIFDLLDTEPPTDPFYTNLTEHMKKILLDLDCQDDDLIVSINVSSAKRANPVRNICPTLVAANNIPYLVKINRRLTITECLRLQGFDTTKFHSVVSRRQTHKQIGNSMSVNVLVALFKEIFKSVQF